MFSQKIVLDNLENNFDLHLTFIYLTVIKSRQNVKENTKNKYLNVLLLFSQKKNFEASRRGKEAFYNFFPTSYDHWSQMSKKLSIIDFFSSEKYGKTTECEQLIIIIN